MTNEQGQGARWRVIEKSLNEVLADALAAAQAAYRWALLYHPPFDVDIVPSLNTSGRRYYDKRVKHDAAMTEKAGQ